MILRGYQTEATEAILRAWGELPSTEEGNGETYRSCVCNLATSAGKTIVAGEVIRRVRPKGRCLFLADTDELCDQPVRKFAKMGIHCALEKAERYASPMADVVVGSAQTLIRENRRGRFHRDHFSYVFVDEAHRGSDRNKVITDHFSGAKICGMTATAFRAKLRDLSKYYEAVAYELGIFDLIGEGYIVPLKVQTLPVEVDISKVRQSMSADGMDYNVNELDTTIAPYFEEIIKLIKEHASNRQIISFLPLIRTSEAFAAACRNAGLQAKHIDGKSPERAQILQAFAQKRFQILCNSNLLTTGWDCEAVDCLLNLRPTRSAGLYRQMVGRIGRLIDPEIGNLPTKEERKAAIASSAKPSALILDLLWQSSRFGLQGPADLIAANEGEREAIEQKARQLRLPAELEAIAAQVQAEREAKLKEELGEARKRAQQGYRSHYHFSVPKLAIVLHSRKLLNFEPTAAWHELPVTDKQKEWLNKQGIDPETAINRGHAYEVSALLLARREAGLCSHWAAEVLANQNLAVNVTELHAYELLGEDMPFPFSKYAGWPYSRIPSGMWDWCRHQPWIKGMYPVVWKHMFQEEDSPQEEMFEVLS